MFCEQSIGGMDIPLCTTADRALTLDNFVINAGHKDEICCFILSFEYELFL
jgi:hypothetical protein